MSENRSAWRQLLDALEQRTTTARAMGGREKIKRQHDRGRLTARERIALLCDDGSFSEYGELAGGHPPGGGSPVPGDALVGGRGHIDGRTVVLFAEDFTVMGGSIGHANAAKRGRLVRLAAEQQLPLVMMLDGAGERAGNALERYPHAPNDLQLLADLKGVVPIVSLVLGNSAGHSALSAMFADLVIMQRGAALFTAGPPLVHAALGIETTPAELGAAQMHSSVSGVAHNTGATEQDCFAIARHFLSLLPQHAGAAAPECHKLASAKLRPTERLLDIIPPSPQQAYNMGEVLEEIVDKQSLLELQPDFGASLVAALASIGGVPCLIIANHPAVQAGAITSAAAAKAAHFIDVAGNFGLPLLMLIDTPGAMPGPDAERAGILRAAAQMFLAQRRYRGRKIVVTLRKAFGFGSSVMGMNPWDRQVISLALPSVTLGGVPAQGLSSATGVAHDQAERLREVQSGAWAPADAMAFDKIIDPAQLRNEIIAALQR